MYLYFASRISLQVDKYNLTSRCMLNSCVTEELLPMLRKLIHLLCPLSWRVSQILPYLFRSFVGDTKKKRKISKLFTYVCSLLTIRNWISKYKIVSHGKICNISVSVNFIHRRLEYSLDRHCTDWNKNRFYF